MRSTARIKRLETIWTKVTTKKSASVVDKIVKANLAKKKAKEIDKEKTIRKIFGRQRNLAANARKEWSK